MRQGVTLVELMVTLAVIGLVASVATLAIGPAPPPADDTATRVARARHAALTMARDTTIRLADSVRATARADGSIVADSVVGVERLTGALHEHRR